MAIAQRFTFSIDDLVKARGESDELSFQGGSVESFAELFQGALREPTLWRRWRAMQPDPDEVDPASGASDPNAIVTAQQTDVHVTCEVISALPHAIIQHRLTLLIGKHWKLRNVSTV
ncbi:hypothetical protein [Dokdonella sp.]|uniref:hypothetical protein n=1 Tax=Dokdonella sp. TaxID=2291710 RepID=UPI0031C36630|nr:hypothetical protein [Dokdonella sp.]